MHCICILLVYLYERLLPFIKRNIMFYRLKLDSKVVQANQEDTAKRKRKIQEIIVDDETLIIVGNQFAWLLWIAVDSINKLILGIHISFERTILVAE